MAQAAQLMIEALGLLYKLPLDSLTGWGNLESKPWEFSRWARGTKSTKREVFVPAEAIIQSWRAPVLCVWRYFVQWYSWEHQDMDQLMLLCVLALIDLVHVHLRDAARMPGSNPIHCLFPLFCFWSTRSIEATPLGWLFLRNDRWIHVFQLQTARIECKPECKWSSLSETQPSSSASARSSKKKIHWQTLVTCGMLWMQRRVPEKYQHLKCDHPAFCKSLQAGFANALSRCQLFLSACIWRQPRDYESHWYGACRPCRHTENMEVNWDCTDELLQCSEA